MYAIAAQQPKGEHWHAPHGTACMLQHTLGSRARLLVPLKLSSGNVSHMDMCHVLTNAAAQVKHAGGENPTPRSGSLQMQVTPLLLHWSMPYQPNGYVAGRESFVDIDISSGSPPSYPDLRMQKSQAWPVAPANQPAAGARNDAG